MEERPAMADFLDNGDTGARVVDATGRQAGVVSMRHAEDPARVRLAGGMQLLVPADLLTRQDDGSYRLPFAVDPDQAGLGAVQMAIPVAEEQLQFGKRLVDTGRGVRLRKTVSEHAQLVDQTLRRDELTIDRVPVGQVVAGPAPQTRYEGDTLVVPVLEEVLVVQKQLLLKEEVRIRRHIDQVRAPQTVSLKSEQVAAERFDESGNRQA